jgi:hypothetical protein
MPATIPSKIFLLTVCHKKAEITTHITLILPVVLYGCENWFVTLKDGNRLRVFENMELRKISGPNSTSWQQGT